MEQRELLARHQRRLEEEQLTRPFKSGQVDQICLRNRNQFREFAEAFAEQSGERNQLGNAQGLNVLVLVYFILK